MMRTNDFEKSLDKLVSTFFIKHRGRLLEGKDGGFLMGRQWYPSIEEVDRAIDWEYSTLENSISRK